MAYSGAGSKLTRNRRPPRSGTSAAAAMITLNGSSPRSSNGPDVQFLEELRLSCGSLRERVLDGSVGLVKRLESSCSVEVSHQLMGLHARYTGGLAHRHQPRANGAR